MPVEKQVAIIYCGTKGLLMKVPVDKIRQFEDDFLHQMELKHNDMLQSLRAGKLDDSVLETLEKVAKEIAGKYTD
jgi:F-type H+-transporting ATPase subunit alpha